MGWFFVAWLYWLVSFLTLGSIAYNLKKIDKMSRRMVGGESLMPTNGPCLLGHTVTITNKASNKIGA